MSISAPAQTKIGEQAGSRHAGLVLAIIVTCQMMVVVDAMAMAVALPEIQAGLHFSATGLPWVLNAYILSYGGLLLLGGRTGDVLGRRRTFTAGVLLFTVSSLLGGLATDAGWLLAARALQGAGAAFAAPGAMSLLMANFAEGPARDRALSAYATVAGLGMAIGMIVSGVLTDIASWRWVLLVNVPLGLAIVVLTPRYVAEPQRHPGQIDLPSAATATAGGVALAWAFIHASDSGWTATTLGAVGLGIVLLALFVRRQSRVEQPMMPLRLIADRTRAAALVAMALAMASNFNISLFVPQFLQDVLHYSALQAGLAFLPMALVVFAVARGGRGLLPRFGPFPLILIGIGLCAVGIGWLGTLDAGSTYAAGMLVPLILIGLGIGTFLMPLTGLILKGVEPRDSGAVSGVLQTFQQFGGAIGIAVLVTVYGTALRHSEAGTAPRTATAHAIADAFLGGAGFLILALLSITVAALAGRARRAATPPPA
ncbi:MFS transporter [Protofrankia symbiont of Coriaria ruscifolia]|uniref:MFS transporter n=1 Tax=Protofrankia symbiont of Coriaria ruscifolia TaxID=1306542 RepID=UPI00104197FF|nr:MFS transporter [Protofrankia symbiont of Coriaria ruscifolia]